MHLPPKCPEEIIKRCSYGPTTTQQQAHNRTPAGFSNNVSIANNNLILQPHIWKLHWMTNTWVLAPVLACAVQKRYGRHFFDMPFAMPLFFHAFSLALPSAMPFILLCLTFHCAFIFSLFFVLPFTVPLFFSLHFTVPLYFLPFLLLCHAMPCLLLCHAIFFFMLLALPFAAPLISALNFTMPLFFLSFGLTLPWPSSVPLFFPMLLALPFPLHRTFIFCFKYCCAFVFSCFWPSLNFHHAVPCHAMPSAVPCRPMPSVILWCDPSTVKLTICNLFHVISALQEVSLGCGRIIGPLFSFLPQTLHFWLIPRHIKIIKSPMFIHVWSHQQINSATTELHILCFMPSLYRKYVRSTEEPIKTLLSLCSISTSVNWGSAIQCCLALDSSIVP